MKKYIIALDQGTTSSRAIIFDKNLNIINMEQREFPQIFPKAGWVEQNPLDIYISQYSVLTDTILKSGISPKDIAGIGISNQRETTIVWDKNTGKPIYNAIVWQCRRTANICEKLKEDGLADYIKSTTGLIVDAYFSATKIKWILDNVGGAREKAENGELLFGTVDTWLLWKLTNGEVHATDYTNASRTMLFDIKNIKWDEKILKALDIPMSMLPEVKNSSAFFGGVNIQGELIPICGIAGDQQAALFGQACFEKGDMKNTYGTGCFTLFNTGEEFIESKNGLLTTIIATETEKVNYALEGSVFVGGSIIQWLRDDLKMLINAKDSGEMAKKVEDNAGVYIVPAFAGMGAPHWDMYARGTIFGLTRKATNNHIVRAGLEAIAFQTKDVIDTIIADTGIEVTTLKVDGGASINDFLMQFQSDILSIPIIRPVINETSALGSAFLAGLEVGFWKDKNEIKEKWLLGKKYTPKMENSLVCDYIKHWKKAVECTKLFKI